MDFNPEYNNLIIIHKIYFNFIYSLIFIFTLCCLKYLYDIEFFTLFYSNEIRRNYSSNVFDKLLDFWNIFKYLKYVFDMFYLWEISKIYGIIFNIL